MRKRLRSRRTSGRIADSTGAPLSRAQWPSAVDEGLSKRAWTAVAYPPLSDMSAPLRREFHEALLESEANMPALVPISVRG